MSEIIKGKRVSLRPIILSDMDFLKKWWKEPEGNYYDSGDPLDEPSETIINTISEQIKNKELNHWFIIENEKSKPVGYIVYRNLDPDEKSVCIAIRLGKDYWDRNYGTESIQIFMKKLFKEFDLESIKLTVFDFNTRAIHVYEKCGFKKVDSVKDDDGKVCYLMVASKKEMTYEAL